MYTVAVIHLRPKDGRWYEMYRKELKNLWESSEEWNAGKAIQDLTVANCCHHDICIALIAEKPGVV